jgi:hypothetical protein
LTPYTDGCVFFLQSKFSTSLLAWLAGDNEQFKKHNIKKILLLIRDESLAEKSVKFVQGDQLNNSCGLL